MKKTALVTGASGGIGLEIARVHASMGDDLVLVARSRDALERIRTEFEPEYNIKVWLIVKDLSVPGSAKEVYDEVIQQKIRVDFLINNAGFGDYKHFAESDWGKQERMINLNILALTHLTRLFLPDMISAGSGKIMNVASTAAFQPGPNMSVYFASKAFVLYFSEALSEELRDSGITVTALCPGPTESRFQAVVLDKPDLVETRKKASAKFVAEYGYRAMMKGKAVAIPGFFNALAARMVGFFPRKFIVKMARRVQENKIFRQVPGKS